MDVICGDETGLIKLINLKNNSVQSVLGFQDTGRAVKFLRFAGPLNNIEEQIAGSLQNGIVEVWRPSDGSVLADFNAGGNVVGFDVFHDHDNIKRVISCNEKGKVRIGRFSNIPLNESESENSDSHDDDDDSDDSVEELIDKEIECGQNIYRMRLETMNRQTFATGGKEHLLRLWDIETAKITFKARNVPHDFLELRVPVWIRDLQFLPNSTTKLVTGTGYNQIRLYDTRIKKRAVWDKEIDESPIVSISCDPNGHNLVCGNGIGTMFSLDLRTSKEIGRFKGIGGSIRCIEHHPSLPFVASVGLDRFLRIHHIHHRTLEQKVYLKQRLNAVLVSSNVPEDDENNSSSSESEEELEIWNQLDENKKTKRPINKNNEPMAKKQRHK